MTSDRWSTLAGGPIGSRSVANRRAVKLFYRNNDILCGIADAIEGRVPVCLRCGMGDGLRSLAVAAVEREVTALPPRRKERRGPTADRTPPGQRGEPGRTALRGVALGDQVRALAPGAVQGQDGRPPNRDDADEDVAAGGAGAQRPGLGDPFTAHRRSR